VERTPIRAYLSPSIKNTCYVFRSVFPDRARFAAPARGFFSRTGVRAELGKKPLAGPALRARVRPRHGLPRPGGLRDRFGRSAPTADRMADRFLDGRLVCPLPRLADGPTDPAVQPRPAGPILGTGRPHGQLTRPAHPRAGPSRHGDPPRKDRRMAAGTGDRRLSAVLGAVWAPDAAGGV
jgi:hypothetical protein